MPRYRVAILNVGTPRTIAHPRVAASFKLLRFNLLADDHQVSTFLWLSDSAAAVPTKGFAHRSAEVANGASALMKSTAWRQAVDAYAPVVINVSAADMPCRYRGCLAFKCGHIGGPENPSSFLSQRYKVALAYRTARAYAEARSFAFDWFIRTRTDLIHFEPLISLSSLDARAGHVPSGIMTSNPKFLTYNDHLMVCPAGPLCEAYFEVVEHVHDLCTANGSQTMRLIWPYQGYWVSVMDRIAAANASLRAPGLSPAPPRTQHLGIRLFPHAYTLARADGPDCVRLKCDKRNSFATGCVAPHLVEHMAACERERAAWNVATRAVALAAVARK